MKASYLLWFILLLAPSMVSAANCTYNDKSYPEGSVIGPYKCSDGKWVKK